MFFWRKSAEDIRKSALTALKTLSDILLLDIKAEEGKQKEQKKRALLYSKYADLVRSVCSILLMSIAETVVKFIGCKIFQQIHFKHETSTV
jgi:hypothetical protein